MTKERMFSTSMLKRLNKVAEDFDDLIACLLLNEQMLQDDSIHHITMRDNEDTISFCPKGKEQEVTESGAWALKGRQTMKIGRMVRAIVRPDIVLTDKDIEQFTHRLFRTTENEQCYEFKIVEGENIADAYHWQNYIGELSDDEDEESSFRFSAEESVLCQSGAGLFCSCMRYSDAQQYLKIYTRNPHKIKLLVMKHRRLGSVMGRALVWSLDSGKIFMDRIYACHDRYVEEFKKYAADREWMYKSSQGTGSGSIVHYVKGKGEVHDSDPELTVSGIQTAFSHMPYMDTLFYTSGDNCKSQDGIASNKLLDERIRRNCDTTGGGWTDARAIKCCLTGEVADENECVEITHGQFYGQLALSTHCCTVRRFYDWSGDFDDAPRTRVRVTAPVVDTVMNFEGDRILLEDAVRDSFGQWGYPWQLNTLKDGRTVFNIWLERIAKDEIVSGPEAPDQPLVQERLDELDTEQQF